MAIYSYAKLEAFQNWPEGYKYFTIDGMIPMERGLNLGNKSPRPHFAGSSGEAELEEQFLQFATPYEQRRITLSKLKEGDFD